MPLSQDTPAPPLEEITGRTQEQIVTDLARFGFKLFAVDTPVYGTILGEGRHEWLVQTGFKVNVTLAPNGLATIFFRKPFPTAVLFVVPWANFSGVVRLSAVTKDFFTVASTPQQTGIINYLAIGC